MTRTSPRLLDAAAWHHHLSTLPQATFSHTPAWARIIREVWGGDATAVLHPTPDGQEALLPLVSRPLARGWLRATISGETGVYGGPLLPSPMAASAWTAFWRDLRRHHGPLTLILPPGHVWQPPEHGSVRIRRTHRLNLGSPDGERHYSRGLRSRLNRARRSGLTIVEGDGGAVATYDRLYRETLGRWGSRTSWVRPPCFFQALFRHGHPHVRLWLAQRDGLAVAGIWVATFGREAHYLAGATAREGLDLGGSHLLLDHALSQATQAGCRVFDFGASGDQDGLVQFKEGFGARPEPYAEVRMWPTALRLYWHFKRRQAPPRQEASC